jgi:hypothetical protein
MELNKVNEIVNKFNNTESIDEQMGLSVELARACGVREDKIFHNLEEFDAFMASDKPLVLGG